MVNELLAVLFLSREVAHREHLKTDSYAQHVALGSFYEEVVVLADSLAEAIQGRTKKRLGDIPIYAGPVKGDIVKSLENFLSRIEELRKEVLPEDNAIQNIIDEVVALYLSTLYKLTFLK